MYQPLNEPELQISGENFLQPPDVGELFQYPLNLILQDHITFKPTGQKGQSDSTGALSYT